MPDVQEVFRLATQKVRPEPGARERQFRRQRKRAVGQKVWVYALVAAFVIAANVIAVTRLPENSSKPANGTKPSSSPAGTSLEHAVVVDLDGRVQVDVSGLPAGAEQLSLSPDGTRIAFPDPTGGISTIGIDGTGLQHLSHPVPAQMPVQMPVWSPTGSQIAFQGMTSRQWDIYVVDADGTNVRRLTRSPTGDEWPTWSPDGSRIIYDNVGTEPLDDSGFSQTSEIYSISTSGGTPTRLTHNGVNDSQPSYSPDGTKIAFSRGEGMWIMDANGSHQREVRPPGSCCTAFTPRWSPDGTRIAFTRYDPRWRWGSLPVVALYVVDVASGKVAPVDNVEMATMNNPPQWLPSGDALLINRVERP
jgi:Tol biopolymer transport system component